MSKWLIVAVAAIAAMQAHEIGTSRVAVLFNDDRSYEITVVTDAVSLADKIRAVTGLAPSSDTDPVRMQALFTGADAAFRGRVKVMFDDAEVRPAVSYSVEPGTGVGAAAVATIRLSGQIPPGAKRFQWSYGWTFASYGVTIRNAASANPVDQWLDGGQMSAPFAFASAAPAVSRTRAAWRYLTLGFTHIVPFGVDHMLFVLGIYLLSGRARAVLTQVSAFTVAHSMTLGLSIYGLVSVSPRVVEPLIALSIAYVAIENLFLSELRRWRIALVFAFGLLHGMGFAGALKDLGLPRGEFLTGLVTFNVGVEIGQLTVIGAAFVLVGWYCSRRVWYRTRVVVPASMAIACMAVYWMVQRIAI